MSRLWSSGFELNSTSIEFTGNGGLTAQLTPQTTTVRSGTYAGQADNTASATPKATMYDYRAAPTQEDVYYRFYFRIGTLPSGTANIAGWTNLTGTGGFNEKLAIRLTTGGALQLFNVEDAVQVGSDSSALSTGVWYRIEARVNTTTLASTTVSAQIDGTVFASGTINLANGIRSFGVGLGSSVNGNVYFDDLAINDTTGSFQNSYPGSGKIIHLRPNAAGDAAGWVRQGTDSGANWSQVNEVTPNDLTQYVNTTTLNAEDLYNLDNSGIGASDTVNVVHVGIRFRGNVATAVPTFVVEAEKTSGGTIVQSSGITPNSTTWMRNDIAAPRNFPLTLYQDPDGSAWTQTTLDSMQIGMKITVDNTNRVDLSTIWAVVDYTPAAPPASNSNAFFQFL